MKRLRFLLVGLAICLASGVKAQFYDSADDIYFYVEYRNGDIVNNGSVMVWNFDGKKAVECSYSGFEIPKNKLKSNPNYYEEATERVDYKWYFVSSSSSCTIYRVDTPIGGYATYSFSSDRLFLTEDNHFIGRPYKKTYKRVDKSFFKVGRSRTPSPIHE